MEDGYCFREPAIVDKESGLYITQAQLQLFCNGVNGDELFKNRDQQYKDFELDCQLWNMAYDWKKDEGYAYWDHKTESVKVVFLKDQTLNE
jgi:hypothetical protein